VAAMTTSVLNSDPLSDDTTRPALPWSPQLFEEITDLLAEALFKDYQEHRRATVNSPPGMNQTNLLTPSCRELN
jgi:hypothetical protein